jgi:hypothetical protein
MTTAPDWAEQARRLLEAVQAAATTEAPAEDGASAGECRWCPHCQLLAVLRGDRPEVTAVLGDVLATASAALHSFSSGEPETARGDAEDEQPHPDPGRMAQRIEIA